MKLSKYGINEWLGGGIVALILLSGAVMLCLSYNKIIGVTAASLIVLTWLCIAAFFRSPARNIPCGDNLILAPADGVIKDIEIIKADQLEFFHGYDMIRIGIFLSVFDVHINRIPTDMIIKERKYRPGKKYDARSPQAITDNESMLLTGECDISGIKFLIGVRQISGAIARRIVCAVEPGMRLRRGATYGMIKFGSRTELFLPVCNEISIKAKTGQRVYAGISILAEIITTRSLDKQRK
jgi:phosphatidylserine decarboxylase